MKAKTKTYKLAAILIIILVFSLMFFRFAKSKQQNVLVQPIALQKNNENAEIAEVQQPTPSPPIEVSDVSNGQTKTMPSSVPIFMYHYIRDYTDASDPIGVNLSVSPAKFEQQIAWLKGNGYQTVFPNFFVSPEALSSKPIILTFDDGYQDAFDSAFPILQKYQMAGMFYLIIDKIGTPGYLTWDEVAQMQNAGMAFGSHTLTHPDLRNISLANMQQEITQSQEILSQKLGRNVTDFCYPSGKYDDAVLAELKTDDYLTATTTDSGVANMKDNLLLLKRLRITQATNVQALLGK